MKYYLNEQKKSIMEAIETLYGKSLLSEKEKRDLSKLSLYTSEYSNPCMFYDTDELKQVISSVSQMAYKYDYHEEIEKLLYSWKLIEDKDYI